RTPFTRYLGQLASLSAVELGAVAVRGALQQAGLAPEQVGAVIARQVLQAGAGQNPARQTAVPAGNPMSTPSMTLDAVCLSGTEAVVQAVRLLDLGETDVVVAVGQESMSQAPHVLPNSRTGTRYGSWQLVDSMDHDGLTDAFEHRSMGASTEPRSS